ncbi:MAG: T9SS type A sorting domain-containing protein [Flavobacteriales bacterium]
MGQDIIQGEIWIDEDLGFGMNPNSFAVTNPAEMITEITSVIAPADIGVHTIGVRTKDENGKWSHTNFGLLRVISEPETDNFLTEVEFYWTSDSGFSANSVITLIPAEVNTQQTAEILVPTGLTEGENYELFARTKDSNGKWSHTNLSNEQIEIFPFEPEILIEEVAECETWTSPDGTVYDSSGTFEEIVLIDNSYFQTVSYEVNIINLESPEIDSTGSTIFTEELTDYIYQWYNCDNNSLISDANMNSYTAEEDGEYAVQITSPEGCEASSECISVVITSILENEEAVLQFYPNPVNNSLYVNASTFGLDQKIRIFDLSGKLINEYNLNQGIQTLDVSDMASGTYLLEFLLDKKMIIEKLIIQ